MIRLRTWSFLAALLAAPVLIHCGSSDSETTKPAATATGDYRGLLTGTAETGVLDVTIAKSSGTSPTSIRPQAPAGAGTDVSGTITMVSGGAKIALTGAYDAASGTLTLTGKTSSGTYTLTGKANGGAFAGTYTSPGGAGSFSLLPATSGAVTLYCGTYDGDSTGVWNLVVDSAGTALGSHCDSSDCSALSGTVTGNAIKLSDPADPATVATGTQTGAAASGTWKGQKSSSGTWQGSVDACGSAAQNSGDAGAGGAPSAIGEAGSGGDTTALGGAAGAGGAPVAVAPTLSPVVAGLTDDFALSADDSFVYFFTSSEVHRCPVAGCPSGLGEKMAGPLAVPSSLATSGSALFFTHDFHLIDTCAVSASPGCTAANFVDVGASSYPAHLKVNGSMLYWVSEAGSARRIQVCPTAGCSAGYPKTILDSANAAMLNGVAVAGLALTSTNLYVASFTGGIFRFDMSNAETVNAASGTQATGSNYGTSELDVDGTHLLWGEQMDARLRTCTTPACMPVTDYLTGLQSPAGVSVTPHGIFIAERGTANGNAWAPGTGAIRVVQR